MSDLAKGYESLRSRVSALEAQRQFWEGKKEANDKAKASLLQEAKALGVEGDDLQTVKGVLERRVKADLASLEVSVQAAEEQFTKLRKTDDNQT